MMTMMMTISALAFSAPHATSHRDDDEEDCNDDNNDDYNDDDDDDDDDINDVDTSQYEYKIIFHFPLSVQITGGNSRFVNESFCFSSFEFKHFWSLFMF